MLRAILDLKDSSHFDHHNLIIRPLPDCAYLLNDSREIPEKALELFGNPEFRRSIWISFNVAELNKESDFRFLSQVKAEAILLRGCTSPADVEKAGVLLTVFEIEQEPTRPPTKIIAAIADTARAVQNLSKWNDLPERLTGLLFDPHALALSMGLQSPFGINGECLPHVETAAHLSLFTAKALNCPIYDATIWKPESNLSQQCFLAHQMGFAGAVARNPNHMDLINAIFS